MNNLFYRSRHKFVFLLGVTAIYVALLVYLDFLQGPFWADEGNFWGTSLTYSDRLIPTLDSLRDYGELNTPLPFVIFGVLEYLFGQDIVAGRLFNFVLSIGLIFVIGWPRGHDKSNEKNRKLLCAVGLLMCPYYLMLSGRLYTEMIACVWAVLGFACYVRDRHLLSCIAFILAISSRQYMLAFPIAIATYEFLASLLTILSARQFTLKPDLKSLKAQWRWIAPTIAALSIFGWIWFFKGLAPETAIVVRKTPAVQKTAWAFSPGVAVNFLAIVGSYIVIPEFLLFQPSAKLKALWKNRYRILLLAVGLALLFLVIPPIPSSRGGTIQIAELLPAESLKLLFLYFLVLFTCIRFYRPNLVSFIILFNSLMMIKAHPWDKYILPVAIVFWYLKSINFEERLSR